MARTLVAPTAAPFIPDTPRLSALAEAAQRCRGCDLYKGATQAVFGEGPTEAKIIFVGEQPGDQEDRQGRPFVGPAGRMLDKALVDAGIDRRLAYVSNAVKHFKFEQRGKMRIHKKPSSLQIRACRPWLEAEVRALKPEAIVCLGATAAQSVLEKPVTLYAVRGRALHHPWARAVFVTAHPSSLLRAPDPEARRAAYAEFVRDLKTVRQALPSTR